MNYDWMDDAACQGEPIKTFFPEDTQRFAGYMAARTICAECPVIIECRTWNDAVESRDGYRLMSGFYAGEGPNDRRLRRRGSPPVLLVPPGAAKDLYRRLEARYGGGRPAAYAYAEKWGIQPQSAERLLTRLRQGFAGHKVFDQAEILDAS